MTPSDTDIQKLLDETTHKMKALADGILQQGRSLEHFIKMMSVTLETGDKIDQLISSWVPEKKDLACKMGCSHCCMLPVVTQPLFAVFTLFYAKTTNNGAAFELASRNIGQQEPGCQYLKDGVCQVYPARPMACRLFHSYRLSNCLEGTFQREVRPQLRGIIAAVNGLTQALSAHGIDCQNVLFKEAVQLLMSEPEVFEKWFRGEAVFERCHIHLDLKPEA